jgi:hypothetical protein
MKEKEIKGKEKGRKGKEYGEWKGKINAK